MRAVDLAVVGGGPVGLACCLEAARLGLSVTLVEPRRPPVDKACGEGLMPAALAAVQRLGIDPDGVPVTGIRYLSADGRMVADAPFRTGPGRGVRRTVLAARLADLVADLGIERVAARVVGLAQDADRVDLEFAPPSRAGAGRAASRLRARWVIAADGLHSTVRTLVGLAPRSNGRRYGIRRHLDLAPWGERVEVYWGPTIEAYVTPVGEREVGIAVLGRAGRDLTSWLGNPPGSALAQLPLLAERVAGAAWSTPARGAGPLDQRVPARSRGRVLLAGDAAGYVDALTGEGLRVGLGSARSAVEAVRRALDAEGPSSGDAVAAAGRDYERAWRAHSRTDRVLTTGLVRATRVPLARSGIVPASRALPGVFAAVVNQLAG